MEVIEIFKVKTLEDIIEEQRAKLAAQGKVGTPVTAESFAIWRAGKLAKRQAEAESRMKELSKKKGGGKGLCKLFIQFSLSFSFLNYNHKIKTMKLKFFFISCTLW